MSQNKQTVKKYMDAFSKSDHEEILSCLTDDVEWVIPGVFHLAGKEAFDNEIENDAFVGSPTIRVARSLTHVMVNGRTAAGPPSHATRDSPGRLSLLA